MDSSPDGRDARRRPSRGIPGAGKWVSSSTTQYNPRGISPPGVVLSCFTLLSRRLDDCLPDRATRQRFEGQEESGPVLEGKHHRN